MEKNKKIIITIAIIVAIFLLFKVNMFRQIIKLIFLSFVLAYILKPISEKLVDMGMSKSLASVTVILVIVLIFLLSILFFIPTIFKEASNISMALYKIQYLIDGIYEKIKPLNSNKILYTSLQNLYSKMDNALINSLNKAVDGTLKVGENIIYIVIIPIISYYFLADFRKIKNLFLTLFPLKSRNIVNRVMVDIDKILGRYIVTQIILSIIIGICTFAILIILRIDFPILLSILNAFFNIIPYFGPIIGGVPCILVAFIKSPYTAIWAIILIYGVQQVEGNIISPKLVGNNISMHPLVVIILLIIGEKALGFMGMIIAIPIGVVVKVIYEDLNYYIF